MEAESSVQCPALVTVRDWEDIWAPPPRAPVALCVAPDPGSCRTPTEGNSESRASLAFSPSRVNKTIAIPHTFTRGVGCDSGRSGGTESDPDDLRKLPEGQGGQEPGRTKGNIWPLGQVGLALLYIHFSGPLWTPKCESDKFWGLQASRWKLFHDQLKKRRSHKLRKELVGVS